MVRKTIGLAILLAVILILLLPVIAYGFTVDPPDGNEVAILRQWVNTDMLETGDMFIYFEYYVPYASLPIVDISQAYTFRLFDSTNTNAIAAAVTYPYFQDGYNYGVAHFYFSAAANPGWGDDYYIRIEGNPLYFSVPFSQSILLDSSKFSTQTTQTANRAEAKEKIIGIARHLQGVWSITLLDQTEVGTALSTYGEGYFRNAIPALQDMIPDIFYVQIKNLSFTNRTWSRTWENTITARFDGTWVGTSLTASGALFGVDKQIVGTMITMVGCIFVVWYSTRRLQSINSGLMDCFTVIITSAALTIFPFGLMALLVYFCWAYIGYILIFRR